MNGLIKNDLMQIALASKGFFWAIYFVIVLGLSIFTEMGTVYCYMLLFVSVMLSISLFSYDEAYHWDRYRSSLPVTSRQIVLARYASAICCMLVGLAACLVLCCVSIISGHMDLSAGQFALSMAQILIVDVLYIVISIPVLYRWGAERGRIVVILLFFVCFGLIGACSAMVGEGELSEWLSRIASISTAITAVLAVVLFPLSVLLSTRQLERREF